MKLAQDIIIKPIITEASMMGIASKKYTFKVATDANKIEIADAKQELEDGWKDYYEGKAKAEMELDAKYPDFGFLMKEFYEGSLLYEISTREVWNKAAEDTEGLEKYFKKNKKNYNYDEPVYRGLVVHCVSDDVLKQVQKLVKKQPQKEWVKDAKFGYKSKNTRASRRGLAPRLCVFTIRSYVG